MALVFSDLAVLNAVMLALLPVHSAEDLPNHGEFTGSFQFEWLEDREGPDREMRLLQDVAFASPDGSVWRVPSGVTINGASIPSVFWSVAGPPFVGNYRRASVVHDYFCQTKEMTWQETHRMFYEAMLAGGVPKSKALILYGAVRGGGPRWSKVAGIEPGSLSVFVTIPEFGQSHIEAVEQYVRTHSPTPQELEAFVDGLLVQ